MSSRRKKEQENETHSLRVESEEEKIERENNGGKLKLLSMKMTTNHTEETIKKFTLIFPELEIVQFHIMCMENYQEGEIWWAKNARWG